MALLELVKSFSVFLSSYLLNSDPEYDAKIRKKPGEKTDLSFACKICLQFLDHLHQAEAEYQYVALD